METIDEAIERVRRSILQALEDTEEWREQDFSDWDTVALIVLYQSIF